MDLALDVLQVLVLAYLVYRDRTREPEVRETIREVVLPVRRPVRVDVPTGPDRGATFKRKRPRWDNASARPVK